MVWVFFPSIGKLKVHVLGLEIDRKQSLEGTVLLSQCHQISLVEDNQTHVSFRIIWDLFYKRSCSLLHRAALIT